MSTRPRPPTAIETDLTDCLRRLREARSYGEPEAEMVFEAAFDRLIEEWQQAATQVPA